VRSYTELPGLANIVLEESYVLDVRATPGELFVDVDFVLTADHPGYVAPPPSEVECYRRGSIRFRGVESLRWEGQGRPPARDASGERDYGSIDSLGWERDHYELSGDFGEIGLRAGSVEVALAPR
jgi:hypothetical protein